MNAAYKWYSHNNNMIKFYSDYSDSNKSDMSSDIVKETVEQTCDYATNLINNQNEINADC